MRTVALALLAALALAGCARAEHLAVVGNAPGSLAVGEDQRMVVAYRTEVGEDLAAPDLPATLVLTNAAGETQEVPTEFVWMTEGVRGLYVAYADLDQPGEWTAMLEPEGRNPTLATPFAIDAEPSTPAVGDPAPTSDSKVATDVGGDLALLSTDPAPEPALYELTVAEAVSNGTPAVLVFATPRFCQTATCGPMLDLAKEVRATTDADIDWVHVEVYELEDLDPSRPEPVPAALEWGLPSEPWVFVTDADGVITHRFEGVISRSELEAAVAEVTG